MSQFAAASWPTTADVAPMTVPFDHFFACYPGIASLREGAANIARRMVWLVMHGGPTHTCVWLITETNSDPVPRFARTFESISGADFCEVTIGTNADFMQDEYASDWFSVVKSKDKSLSYDKITEIINGINIELYEGKFDQLNQMLKDLNPAALSVDAVVAVSRATFPARDKLSFWGEFVYRAFSVLKKQGDEQAMSGLI